MALPYPVPTSLSPSFVMSRCTPENTKDYADAWARVYLEALGTEPGFSFWWPPNREDMFDWLRARIVDRVKDPKLRHFKVTDAETGELVAWAIWEIPQDSTSFGERVDEEPEKAVDVTDTVISEAAASGDRPEAQEAPIAAAPAEPALIPGGVPKGSDPALRAAFFSELEKSWKKWVTKDTLKLQFLSTSPKYFKRGAAKALLVPMLEIADSLGIQAYLEATSAGKPVYEKVGFREVDLIEHDLKKLTKDQDGYCRLTVMIREPRTSGSA